MSNLVELIITAISASGKPLTIQEIVNYINHLNIGRVYDYNSVLMLYNIKNGKKIII